METEGWASDTCILDPGHERNDSIPVGFRKGATVDLTMRVGSNRLFMADQYLFDLSPVVQWMNAIAISPSDLLSNAEGSVDITSTTPPVSSWNGQPRECDLLPAMEGEYSKGFRVSPAL